MLIWLNTGAFMVILVVVLIIMTAMVILLRPWPFFLTPEQSRAVEIRNMAAEFSKWVERKPRVAGLRLAEWRVRYQSNAPSVGNPLIVSCIQMKFASTAGVPTSRRKLRPPNRNAPPEVQKPVTGKPVYQALA